MSDIKIRFMRWGDAEKVTEGIHDSFKDFRAQMEFDQRKYTVFYKALSVLSWFRFLFKRMMTVFVCGEQGNLLGSATLMPWEANTFLYSTINIWNRERKKGLGKELYFARNNYLAENNIPYAVGEVVQTNEAAKGFWSKYCGIRWEFLSFLYIKKSSDSKALSGEAREKTRFATKKEIADLLAGPWKKHPMIAHPSSVNSTFLKSLFRYGMIPPVKYRVFRFQLDRDRAVYARFRQYFLIDFGFIDIWSVPDDVSRPELEESIEALSNHALNTCVKRIWIYAPQTLPLMKEILDERGIPFIGGSCFFRIAVGKDKIEYLPEGPL